MFRDENTGNLIFIAETGSIAIVGGSAAFKAPTPKVKETELDARPQREVPLVRREGVLGQDEDLRHRGLPR